MEQFINSDWYTWRTSSPSSLLFYCSHKIRPELHKHWSRLSKSIQSQHREGRSFVIFSASQNRPVVINQSNVEKGKKREEKGALTSTPIMNFFTSFSLSKRQCGSGDSLFTQSHAYTCGHVHTLAHTHTALTYLGLGGRENGSLFLILVGT